MKPNPLLIAAALIPTLAGCTRSGSTLNNELEIGRGSNTRALGGGVFTPPSLSRSFNTPAELDDDRPDPTALPPKSVWAVDRDNWPIVTLPVPNSMPVHNPIYTRNPHHPSDSYRSRGRYPTAMSVFDNAAEVGYDEQVQEAVEAPLAALADIVMFLPRSVWTPPFSEVRTAYEPYRRAPEMRGSLHPLKVAPTRTEKPDPSSPPVRIPLGDYPPVDSRR